MQQQARLSVPESQPAQDEKLHAWRDSPPPALRRRRRRGGRKAARRRQLSQEERREARHGMDNWYAPPVSRPSVAQTSGIFVVLCGRDHHRAKAELWGRFGFLLPSNCLPNKKHLSVELAVRQWNSRELRQRVSGNNNTQPTTTTDNQQQHHTGGCK